MTEAAMIEAVRATGANAALEQQMEMQRLQDVPRVADPAAVAQFQDAMQTVPATDIPFAQQVAETFRAAQDNHQGLLHRIKALTEMARVKGASAAVMTELQYEVANLSFQQEVVTNIAKKASDAVSTLVKNG